MSYSFTVLAADKAAAKEAVAAEFAKVVANQLVHAKDQAAVLSNAGAVIDLLGDDKDNQDVRVSCNGWVTWTGADASVLTAVSVGCSASHVDRPAAV